MEQWREVQKWTNKGAFDAWLQEQGLTNAPAIIAKVITNRSVTYAEGTRRLRYEKGKFYLDEYFEERTDYGVGKDIDIVALEKRFKSLYPTAQIKVGFNKHPNACALSIQERTNTAGRYSYLIQLNPAKLMEARQVAQRIAEIEKSITK